MEEAGRNVFDRFLLFNRGVSASQQVVGDKPSGG